MLLNRRKILSSSFSVSAGMLLESSSMHALSPGFAATRLRIENAIAQGTVTGIALAVVSKGRIVWEEGFGWADRERGVRSTPYTPYSLASITKAFTATLVASLAQQHHVALDSAAMPYLDTSPLQGPNGNPDDVTIRMLGAHCSGLPGVFSAHLLSGVAPAQSAQAFLKAYGHLAYPPGRIYEYGNIGFEALGVVAERMAKRPFGELMEEHLLRPFALRDSFFGHPKHPSSVAAGYDEHGKAIPPYVTSTPPSGELYASAHDLAIYLLRYLRGGSSSGQRSSIAETLKPVFHGPRGVDTTFGWFRAKLTPGEPYFFKGGGQPGVAAKLFFLPSADVGCAVITNRTDNASFVEECCRDLLRQYVPDFTVPEEDAGPGLAPFRQSSTFAGEWQGTLVNGGAEQPVHFSMRPDGSSTLSLSGRHAEPVTQIQASLPGFEGTTRGVVDCEHAGEFEERLLVLKLIPHDGKLIGRVTARGTRPGLLLANLPYVLTLDRV